MPTKEQSLRYSRGYYEKHRDAVVARSSEYYRLHRTAVLERISARLQGPEGDAIRAKVRVRRAAKREQARLCDCAYYAKNRPQICEKHKHTARQLRAEVLFAYGNRCSCCGINTEAFLTIDHINRGGRKHRAQVHGKVYADLKRRGWPKDEYRLLCMNCNWATRFGQACPHEIEYLVMLGATTAEAGYAKAGTP